MLSGKMLETKDSPHRKIFLYVIAVAVIILTIYYLPNYFFLEKATADHTAFLLNFLGMRVKTNVTNENVFLANIKIVKDCTGLQVIAVFSGILLPLPNAPWKRKLIALVVVSSILYAANLLRIALEFSLVYFDVLPWSLAHYPLSLLLGIMGVLVLVFVADRLLPEFSDFLLSVTRQRVEKGRKVQF
jgi:exosortase/archaeosortase family protein